MAIKGIGVDVVELARITDVVEKHPKFGERLFTEKERARAFEPRKDIAAIAARFAVKEAVSKALGTGIGSVGWKEIETTSAESGAPVDIIRKSRKACGANGGYSNPRQYQP